MLGNTDRNVCVFFSVDSVNCNITSR